MMNLYGDGLVFLGTAVMAASLAAAAIGLVIHILRGKSILRSIEREYGKRPNQR